MDTTADFLIAIKNGYLAKKTAITVNASKTRMALVKILKDEGFVEDYQVTESKPVSKLTINLRYFEKNLPAIANLKKVSKPSVRIYKGYDKVPLTLSGAGLTIISTPEGLMSGRDARKKHLGGEVICQIW